MDDYLAVLSSVGLTEGEAKIYLALLSLGESSAGDILERANIQNSAFHFCINRLIRKGFVSYFKKGKMKVYKPVDPAFFLKEFKEKERKLKEAIPKLRAKRNEVSKVLTAEVFEGFLGVSSLMHTLIEDAKKGDEFLFFSTNMEGKNKEIAAFYHKFDATRDSMGLITKGISPLTLQVIHAKRRLNHVKYTQLPIPQSVVICNDKMGIVSWDEKPTGVLICAKTLVEKQKEYFHQLWGICSD